MSFASPMTRRIKVFGLSIVLVLLASIQIVALSARIVDKVVGDPSLNAGVTDMTQILIGSHVTREIQTPIFSMEARTIYPPYFVVGRGLVVGLTLLGEIVTVIRIYQITKKN